MSSKSSNAAQKPRQTQTLKQRAADVRDAAERTIRPAGASQVTDQPQAASLPEGSTAERGADTFPAAEPVSHDAGGGRVASSGRAPHREHEMGRHETFENAAPIAETLLAGTMLGRSSATALPEPGSEEAKAAFRAACSETDRLMLPARDGYPELNRPDGSSWTKTSLSRAFDQGKVTPTEYARLYRQAAEREHRIEAATIATSIGALWALAHPEACGQDRAVSPEGPEDAALAAIAAHRDAYAVWLPHLDATSEAKGGSPEWYATHEAAAEPMRVETEAYGRLISTPPTTLEGLRALAAYLPAAIGANGVTDADNDALIALGTVSRAILALVDGTPAQAVPDPVDWNDPPPSFMASPALAPSHFVRVPFGLEQELERLHDIALAEFQRRIAGLRERMGENEARAYEAEIRAELFLSALTAATDPGSVGGKALAALDTDHVRAAAEGRVLASSAAYHDDGTVTYCDATGRVHRRPMAHWISFVAMQMHARVSAEITRQVNTSDFSGDEMREFDGRLRRELRADAVSALAFRSERAFAAAEAERSGAEPRDADNRLDSDAELRALAPAWTAARDLYAQRTQEQIAVCHAASEPGPGPAPRGAGAAYEEWQRQVADWRERTGVAEAEDASGEALDDLGDIEDKIAALPAATLAGLKLKALVAQRLDDIDIEWPDGLGAGLARDILAFVEAHAQSRPEASLPPGAAIADGLGLGSMSMDALAATHDVAALIKSVAYAVACQPRCQKGGRGGPVLNAAGALVNWVAETLVTVEDAALTQMRARSPADDRERDTRLRVLAEATVSNGDPEETRTFARELLATVET